MGKRTKTKSKRKGDKILLFLVEGDSDKRTLETPTEAFLDNQGISGIKVKFAKLSKTEDGKKVSGGDPTSDISIYPENIEEQITKRVDRTTEEGVFVYPKEVVKIIQIVDLDGAYVLDENIHRRSDKDLRGEKRAYYADHIETDNLFATTRNLQRKRENIDYLVSLENFKLGSKSIEYSIYFFASNLEHFMYGIQNMDGDKKIGCAKDFSLACMDNPELFEQKMRTGDYLFRDLTYAESWDFIRKRGLNSLLRASNINHMFEDLTSWGKRFMEEQINND